MVLMDIDVDQAQLTLDRFREKIANFNFPGVDQVTVSIGYNLFDKYLPMDQLIGQADAALYHCKTTTRNAVHSYHDLVEKGLLPALKRSKVPHVEMS